MKISSPFLEVAAVLLSLLPVTQAQAYTSWKVADVPSSGLKDISFPMSIANAPHVAGFYFAQQFSFVGQNGVGYTGLQPRKDSDSSSIIHAVFSSFIAGTTSDDDNCSDGADGGAGVSCAADIPATYDGTYQLKISNTEGTTWTGTLVHTDSGNESHIGTYTIPSGSGGITGSQIGFVEYYPWNSPKPHKCSKLPYTSIVFGSPKTSTEGAGEGSLGGAFEAGDCIGKVGFQTERTSDTVKITVGFQ
ncbi:hypothetical protein FQN54_006293 [Arachnomyces sp. PD_36]|nr:hypothetical protein FQN54_006293 [Arachnomyces sp. PD_36]